MEQVAHINQYRKKASDFTPEGLRNMSNQEFFTHFGFSKRRLPQLRRSSEALLLQQEMRQKKRLERENQSRERERRIIEMRLDKEMTLEAIGKRYGITRERVRQILTKVEQREGIRFPSYVATKEVVIMVATRCAVCGSMTEVRNDKHDSKKQYFCLAHKKTNPHSLRFILKCPNWKNMSKSERARWKYRNDPAFIEKLKASQRKYHNSVKHTPEFKERNRKNQKAYHARKRAQRCA